MRITFLIVLLMALLIPAASSSHPGMTDRYDGHKCFKKCENWGILYGEYHLHDKDRKPVRAAKKQKPERRKNAEPEIEPAEASAQPQDAPVKPETVREVVILRERDVPLFDPLLLAALALLILLLIIRMNRRAGEAKGGGR